jgi:hypothetical protein
MPLTPLFHSGILINLIPSGVTKLSAEEGSIITTSCPYKPKLLLIKQLELAPPWVFPFKAPEIFPKNRISFSLAKCGL